MDNKKKVLIVDDDDNLRNVLLDKLSAAGFEASGAIDGADGLKMALDNHPDVILLDVMMPKMDGWQTLNMLRADEWGKTARVIMLTSLDNTDNIAKAVEKRTYEYIIKTDINLDQVVKRVQEAVKT
jgi:DNA-binding response OmpR family regulator